MTTGHYDVFLVTALSGGKNVAGVTVFIDCINMQHANNLRAS